MSRNRYLALALLIILGGGILRTVWLRADPPTTSVGIVWHDEGPWVHNARNRALWGEWKTDNWNPVYIAPVFTALEYVAFESFGVGTWQARTVPVASGVVAVLLLMAGLSAVAGRRAALIGGVLLATEYTWVMWNRAALMESTMTALMVAAWALYATSGAGPAFGKKAGPAAAFLAGVAAVLAFFTKAAAAFFVAALVLDAAVTLAASRPAVRSRFGFAEPQAGDTRAATFTLAGVAAAFVLIGIAFVLPHWSEYWFYNVQMSVERKPSYGIRNFIDRATWLGLSQDIFTRMWPLLVGAAISIVSVFARWRDARPAERLLVWWVLIGWLELVVHDSSTERRYVMFVPAVIALASLLLGSASSILPAPAVAATRRARLLTVPVWLGLAYVTIGSGLRPFLVRPGSEHPYALAVEVSAVLTVVLVAFALTWWPAIRRSLSALHVAPRLAAAIVVGMVAWNLGTYASWAKHHNDVNYRASLEVGRLLPPGTLVQGKLANGLALENRIRPIFVGRGFGNYTDRFDRDDVRYILTYDLPELGYESQNGSGLIEEILDRYPNRQTVATFEVDETPGADRAVLIDKHPGTQRAPD